MQNLFVSIKRAWGNLQNSASNNSVIDASAFYSGFPFLTLSKCYTTNSILNEIKHMNQKYGAIELLIDSDRLKILEPNKECLRQVITIAKKNWWLWKTFDCRCINTCSSLSVKVNIDFRWLCCSEYCCHFKYSSRDYWN